MKQPKLILFLFLVGFFNLCLTACNKEDDFFMDNPVEIVIIDRGDSVIVDNNGDTTKHVHIIDTVKYVKKKQIVTDFDELSNDNIVVEKAFVMEKHINNSFQGLAIYKDYLFQTYHSKACVDVYDLTNNQFVFSMNQKAESNVHCNNVDFGNQFYEESDPFPLLYLEHRGTTHKTSVYRIVKNDGEFSLQKVQTFNFSPCSWSITNNDSENGYMYISHDREGPTYYIAKINIPDYNQGDLSVTLDTESCLECFPVEDHTGKVGQDATIYKNKLFQLKGYSSEGELLIHDLKNHNLIISIDLRKVGISGEPEGIAWYKDHIIISNINGQVYNMYFVK